MLQLRHIEKSLVVRIAVIVAVLLAAETSALSILFVDSAALAIHKWTLHLLVALMSSFYAVKYSRHKYVHIGNYAAHDV